MADDPSAMGTVYVLKDPDTGAVVYVGGTTTTLQKRLYGHFSSSRRRYGQYPLKFYLRRLTAEAKEPIIEPLFENCGAALHAIEASVVRGYRSAGVALLNKAPCRKEVSST